MNLLKTTILAGTVAAAFLSTASANTVLRLTGSTAFRAATHKAITHLLDGGSVAGYEKIASGARSATATTIDGADRAVYIGTITTHPELGTVTIKTSWSGSTGGIQTVSNQLDVTFLPDAPTGVTLAAATVTAGVASGGTQILPSDSTDVDGPEKPQTNMADTYQAATPFVANTLHDTPVGVQPFKVIASKGAATAGAAGTGFGNLNTQLAIALWGNGTLPLSLFTGNVADEGALVYATGRDADSGTRVTAFSEWGIGANSVVTQYQPQISGGAVTGYVLYPQSTINGITFPTGQGGEASGSTLRSNMTATTNDTVGYSITYLSTGDAGTSLTGGAKELSWNGFFYSPTNVIEGLYTFCYEHLDYLNSFSGAPKTVADALATQILTVDSPVLISSMHCVRTVDGGTVTGNQ